MCSCCLQTMKIWQANMDFLVKTKQIELIYIKSQLQNNKKSNRCCQNKTFLKKQMLNTSSLQVTWNLFASFKNSSFMSFVALPERFWPLWRFTCVAFYLCGDLTFQLETFYLRGVLPVRRFNFSTRNFFRRRWKEMEDTSGTSSDECFKHRKTCFNLGS